MLAAVIPMKRLVIALTALLTLIAGGAVALAANLPQNGSVTVTNDSGAVVGTGTIANGHLSLQLQTGTSGFVTIAVTGGAAGSQTFQAMVDRSGDVTVMNNSQFQDLPAFAKASGMAGVDVSESADAGAAGATDHASATGQTEKAANAAAPQQQTDNSQADSHSQGNGQVTGSKQPGQSGGSSDTAETETETHAQVGASVGSGDDSVDVGADVGTSTSSN